MSASARLRRTPRVMTPGAAARGSGRPRDVERRLGRELLADEPVDRGGEQPRAVLDVARGAERPQQLRVQLDVGGGPALGVRAQPRAPLRLDPQRVADERALAVGRGLALDRPGELGRRAVRRPAPELGAARRDGGHALVDRADERRLDDLLLRREPARGRRERDARLGRDEPVRQPVGPDARDDGERAVDDARAGEVGGRGHRYKCTGAAERRSADRRERVARAGRGQLTLRMICTSSSRS